MFVKTEGPRDANILIVGEAPGEEESRVGRPFRPTQPAGRTLNKVLTKAGLSRQEVPIANVARERPPGNKIAFFFEDYKRRIPKEILIGWIDYLKKEIEEINPNIIIALGDVAMWALTGKTNITTHRGYITECTLVHGVKVLPTYHPQAANYDRNKLWPLVMDIRKAVANSKYSGMPDDPRILITNFSRSEYIQWLQHVYHDHKGPLAVDIETTVPTCHIDIMGIATSSTYGVAHQIVRGGHPIYSPEKEEEVWYWIAKVLGKHPLIMQNGLFDACVLWYRNHILCKNIIFDTMIAAHVCWPECPRSLAFLGSVCLNVPEWKSTSDTFPTLYNAGDAVNTYGIHNVLKKEIKRIKQEEVFHEEMKQIYPAMMLQLQGLWVDPDERSKLLKTTTEELTKLEKEIEQEVGKKINLNSPKQLQNLLYIDMRLPIQYKRRKSVKEPRKQTADAEALKKLARKTKNDTLAKILKAKKLLKLKSSFLEMEVSPDNRVHTSYNVTGATMTRTKGSHIFDDDESYKSFGRWSSSKSIILPYGSGNLQNIPYEARKMYRAPDGYMITQADYMQAEAVVVAYETRDIFLINLFKESFGLSREERKNRNLDVHKLTASMLFGVPIGAVTKEQRKIGKALRHATNYSAGPSVVANKLGCSLTEGKQLLQRHLEANPQLTLWHRRLRDQLRRNRTLYNLFGRRHEFLGRWGDQLFRSAYSYIPQSTVGELLNRRLSAFYKKYGNDIAIILQLHDAIYTLHRHDEDEDIRNAMRECMLYPLVSSYQEEFTIDVDFSIGPSWGELEEV